MAPRGFDTKKSFRDFWEAFSFIICITAETRLERHHNHPTRRRRELCWPLIKRLGGYFSLCRRSHVSPQKAILERASNGSSNSLSRRPSLEPL